MVNKTFNSLLSKNNIVELESGYDFDRSHVPEHVKGDEFMSPVSIKEYLRVPSVTAKGFSEEAVKKKLEINMKSELESMIKENNQIDYYKSGSFKMHIDKHLSGLFYSGVAETGAKFAVAYKD